MSREFVGTGIASDIEDIKVIAITSEHYEIAGGAIGRRAVVRWLHNRSENADAALESIASDPYRKVLGVEVHAYNDLDEYERSLIGTVALSADGEPRYVPFPYVADVMITLEPMSEPMQTVELPKTA